LPKALTSLFTVAIGRPKNQAHKHLHCGLQTIVEITMLCLLCYCLFTSHTYRC